MNGQEILAFHIGRGGRFNNGGYRTFKGFKAIDKFTDDLFMNKEETEYIDGNGNSVGLLVDNDGTGSIDIDGDFDTIYCKRLDDFWGGDMNAVLRSDDFRKLDVLEYYVRNVNDWYEYDLFEHQEYLSKNVKDVINAFNESEEEDDYKRVRYLIAALDEIGYVCDYGLDGVAIDLRFKL